MSEQTDYANYLSKHPLSPKLAPLFGPERIREQEEDYEYMKYLYPKITKKLLHYIEEECDQLEYQGSPMFDAYPDRITFQLIARKIMEEYKKEDPQSFSDHPSFLRDLVEVLLYHEMLYRRNRYRNRRRLYF